MKLPRQVVMAGVTAIATATPSTSRSGSTDRDWPGLLSGGFEVLFRSERLQCSGFDPAPLGGRLSLQSGL